MRLFHKKNLAAIACILCFLTASPIHAQKISDNIDLGGYLKELGSVSFSNELDEFHYDNIIHYRLESEWEISDAFSARLDVRNRLLNGYSVLYQLGYAALLDRDPGYLDLSWLPVNSSNTILHTQIDRLHLTYNRGDYRASLGRQRINWSKTFVWSPNDLFNNFAYLNFDYEERPGTDAFNFEYSWDFASSVHFAFQFGNKFNEMVAAAMLREHSGTYDWQIVAGHYYEQLAFGGGWSGYISNAGFKGEVMYFHPEDQFFDEAGQLTATVGVDYMLSSGLYLQSEFLYNGGFNRSGNPLAELIQPPSADDLFIARSGIFLNSSYQLHPLVNGSLGFMGSFDRPLFIIIPQITVSVTETVDLLLLSQFLKGSVFNRYVETPNLFFFRLKWSY